MARVSRATTMLRPYATFDTCYGDALLHGAPTGTIQKLPRVQNKAARIVLQAPRRSDAKPLLRRLHWLPVEHRIIYMLAVVTYKVRSLTLTLCNLKTHVKFLEYPLPLQIGGPRTTFLGRFRNLTATLTAYIFGVKHNIHK